MFDLQSQLIIKGNNKTFKEINYKRVNNILEEKRVESRMFIEDILSNE